MGEEADGDERMNKNKNNAYPTVGAAEQARAGNILADGDSHNYCTTNSVTGQFKILISDYLSYGQENAIPLRHLKKATGLDGRTVRRMISDERLSGVPILADNSTGYYLPANEDERRRCVRSMKHRAGEIERVAKAIEVAEVQQSMEPARRTLDTASVQMRMEGV